MWDRIRRGTNDQAIGLTVTTRDPVLNTLAARLNPQPYYLIASNCSIGYERFLNLLMTIKERLIKGWLICLDDDIITHELTLSNGGVSIDGRLKELDGIGRGLEYIRGKLPDALALQRYYLGWNAQAIILGEPQSHNLNEEAFLVYPCSQETEGLDAPGLFLDGTTALPVSSMVHSLLKEGTLLRMKINQPALSIVISHLDFYRDLTDGSFSYECYFRPANQHILDNLEETLFCQVA